MSLDETLTAPSLALLIVAAQRATGEVLLGARGLIAAHQPVIYCEDPAEAQSSELFEMLFSYGYRAWWHRPPRFNPNNYFGNSENHFIGQECVHLLCVHSSVHVEMKGAQEVMSSDDRSGFQASG